MGAEEGDEPAQRRLPGPVQGRGERRGRLRAHHTPARNRADRGDDQGQVTVNDRREGLAQRRRSAERPRRGPPLPSCLRAVARFFRLCASASLRESNPFGRLRSAAAILLLALAATACHRAPDAVTRSEEHTSELQSIMRTSYAVFCLEKKQTKKKK